MDGDGSQNRNQNKSSLYYYDLDDGDNEDPCVDQGAYPSMSEPWWNSPGLPKTPKPLLKRIDYSGVSQSQNFHVLLQLLQELLCVNLVHRLDGVLHHFLLSLLEFVLQILLVIIFVTLGSLHHDSLDLLLFLPLLFAELHLLILFLYQFLFSVLFFLWNFKQKSLHSFE